MKRIFVGSLPPEATQDSIREMFSEYGTVCSIDIARDIFTGKCKGFGFVEMEGHEARVEIKALDRKILNGNSIKLKFEEQRKRGRR